jgi:LPS sulfotransferase NodH
MGAKTTAYIVAATPRSGSFYVTECLRNTGICGRPSEYVRREDTHIWSQTLGASSYENYLSLYLARGWTGNGVFGAKLMWDQLVRFAEDLSGYTF